MREKVDPVALAKTFNVHRRTVYAWIRRGAPAYKERRGMTSRYGVYVDEIQHWLDKQAEAK